MNISSSNTQQSPFQRSQSFQTDLIQPAKDLKKTPSDEDSFDQIEESVKPTKTINNNENISNEDATINHSKNSFNNYKESKVPVEIDDHNRTMVLQVDRTDLRLISPDRKVILLHKHHRDVNSCMQVSFFISLLPITNYAK